MAENIGQYNRMEEEKVREFWDKQKIVKKVREKAQKGKPTFYFMDGPPYATGHIHLGTALNKIMKDCAIRSQRMQGKKIFDRPGYDTHGLPIENKVEKKLGFRTKQDIEDYGIDNFVKECRAFATEFVDTMGQEFNNLADWMDYKNPYLTLTNDYIEAIWFAFKKAEEKGLLYLGQYPVHVCPHCATAVAYNEIVYTKLPDTAIFVKLKVNGAKSKIDGEDLKDTYLLVWTTTPWTLPANTGVMVHPKYDYSFVKMSNGEKWIIAKDKVGELMKAFEAGYTLGKAVKGTDLEGMTYDPLFPEVVKDAVQKKNAFRVILSDRYVTLDVGSGLVHTAPGHGKEDYDAGTKAGLPAISPVNLDGTFTKDVPKYAGKQAREANAGIVAELQEKNLIPYTHAYTHDYPLCWRCDSPLLMISVPQWFLKVSSIREKMLKSNAEVNWEPAWMKDRMRNWIENLSDWPVSRARYWGAPLPIWTCPCGEKKVIGSIAELKKESGLQKVGDLHKPHIDTIKLKCKCGKEMRRVPEILDVWFDAGVSSWANLGYPQEKALFDEFWPADLNIEMTEQVRGWWNAQCILSTICFDRLPYKSVSVHGMVLDIGHRKMSKSKGAVSPEEVIAEYNRDYLRTYMLQMSKGTDFSFDMKGVQELNTFFNTLTNSLNYAHLYMKVDLSRKPGKKLMPEDSWFLSRVAKLSSDVLGAYNAYEFSRAVAAIMEFVDKDFSRTYLQLIRRRLGSPTQAAVDETVSFAINVLLRLFAPIAPHACEYYYRQFDGKKWLGVESVHLLDFADVKGIRDEDLEKEFEFVGIVSQAALALRSEQKLRVRWQLEELVLDSEQKISKLSDPLAKMVNVKRFSMLAPGKAPSAGYASRDFGKGKIYLKTEASPQLREEWELSELMRMIQDARKKAGLKTGQKVALDLGGTDEAFIKRHKARIEEKTSTTIRLVKSSAEKTEKLVDREFFFSIRQ